MRWARPDRRRVGDEQARLGRGAARTTRCGASTARAQPRRLVGQKGAERPTLMPLGVDVDLATRQSATRPTGSMIEVDAWQRQVNRSGVVRERWTAAGMLGRRGSMPADRRPRRPREPRDRHLGTAALPQMPHRPTARRGHPVRCGTHPRPRAQSRWGPSQCPGTPRTISPGPRNVRGDFANTTRTGRDVSAGTAK